MRIVFIEVDTERTWSVASIGPGFVGAFLRAHGHDVSLYRATADTPDDQVVAALCELDPDIVGMSLTTRQWLRGRAIAAGLRARSTIPLIAGGLHPTFAPESVLASPGFDYVCLGEGEQAMLELVTALESGAPVSGIDNIWVAGGERPRLRPPVADLDALPFAARDLLDEHRGVAHMATQRGCPFPCTYCAARIYNQLYKPIADYGRRRSHDDVIDELRGLADSGHLAYAIFLDDTFTIHHPWVREFCARYGAEVGAPFSLHARVETVNEAMLHMLAGAGCNQITYGVESGSERVRREVMRRPVRNQRFIDVFRWTREAGIAVTANYMLGLPGETRDDLEMTLALAEELEVLDFGYFVFYPYPGTHLFTVCRDRGYLPDNYLELPAVHGSSILELPDLGRDDIAEYYDRFTDLRRRLYAARNPGAGAAATDHVDELAELG